MKQFKFNKNVLQTRPYKLPSLKPNKIHLDLNESFVNIANNDEQCIYPRDKQIHDACINEISKYAKCMPSNVLLTNGSDNALRYIFSLLCHDGSHTLVITPTYNQVYTFLSMNNAQFTNKNVIENDVIPLYNDLVNAVKNGLDDINPDVVYICNPNNPLGYVLSCQTIEMFLSLYNTTVFIIDEAYMEYCEPYQSMTHLINKYENLVITKTFSKGFGLAGIRLGFIIANTTMIEYIKNIYNEKDVLDISKRSGTKALQNLDFYATQFKIVRIVQTFTLTSIQAIIKTYPNGNIYLARGDQGGFIQLFLHDCIIFEKHMDDIGFVVRNRNDQVKDMVRVQIGTLQSMSIFVDACRSHNYITFFK